MKKRKNQDTGKVASCDEKVSLSRSFFSVTVRRIESIKNALLRLKTNSDDLKSLDEIKNNFHKISGSSGVYGYPKMGSIAKREESRIFELEREKGEIDDDFIDLIMQNTLEIESQINEAMKRENINSDDLCIEKNNENSQIVIPHTEHNDRTPNKARILIVDDDETILQAVETYLSRAGYNVRTAEDAKTALEEIFKFSPDMIILDIILPDIDGMDLMKIIRTRPGGNILPIMFLTAKDGLEDRIQGLSIGGDDYITKPFYPEEMVARVGALMARTTLLKELAVKDGLTGVYNHRYFYERLIEEITRWKRYKRKFTLVLMDLDFFKRVNDNYGHMIGDHVLRQTAEFLKQQLRNVDVVSRYGGEEFALILPETDLKDAQLVLNRIYEKILEWRIPLPGSDDSINITLSAGVATCPEDGEDEKSLVSNADRALYFAKENGREQFIIFREMEQIQESLKDKEKAEEKQQKILATIFVAEDDFLISNMLKIYLENENFRVSIFPNGAELLAVIGIDKPDLILLDVMMPIMDGLKTLEILKSQEDIKNIPVILLTSLDDRNTTDMHKKLGASEYVQKPFNPEHLISIIRDYI